MISLLPGTGNVDAVIAPPSCVTLRASLEVLSQPTLLLLSHQNVYWEESGAFTGETSPAMLTPVGATYCIIGHLSVVATWRH